MVSKTSYKIPLLLSFNTYYIYRQSTQWRIQGMAHLIFRPTPTPPTPPPSLPHTHTHTHTHLIWRSGSATATGLFTIERDNKNGFLNVLFWAGAKCLEAQGEAPLSKLPKHWKIHMMFRSNAKWKFCKTFFCWGKISYTVFFFSLVAQEKWPLKAYFCAEICGLKASVGRIAACACLCKPSASLVICWLLSFSLSLSTGKEQTIIVSISLFSVVVNICDVCHWKWYYICSLGVNKSCQILFDTTPHVHQIVCFSLRGLSLVWSGPWFLSSEGH